MQNPACFCGRAALIIYFVVFMRPSGGHFRERGRSSENADVLQRTRTFFRERGRSSENADVLQRTRTFFRERGHSSENADVLQRTRTFFRERGHCSENADAPRRSCTRRDTLLGAGTVLETHIY